MLPSPFDELGPHPLAREAAKQLQREVAAIALAEDGKMFGVLVVQDRDGRMGYLKAFSGMVGSQWELPGFVPPVFDRAARGAVELPGEAAVKRLIRRSEELANSPEWRELRDLQARQQELHAHAATALKSLHEERRARRHAERQHARDPEAARALDDESRRDKSERRQLTAAHAREQGELQRKLARFERRARALERLRQYVCRRLMRAIHDSYRLTNARGEASDLRALFRSTEPPSGAADCCAPKLLTAAFRAQLRPIALAEVWCGPTPAGGGRVAGAFYPACRGKCGPLLPFMLRGLEVASPRLFAPPASAPELVIVYEDEALVVLEKPAGLLSVPGRGEGMEDSVLTRLRCKGPRTERAMLVHRLDQDTSGLLIAALDARAYVVLQRQFVLREVLKQYVAWIEGAARGEAGTIDFALRVDLEDRPRQIHDPVHGKRAVTSWSVLERRGGRTRLSLSPLTGRTHQLRVHSAHPLGLGAPIVGDRLYGRPAERLLLHAESLTFFHPRTRERLTFRSPAPF
jgi:tRNA pseudouridine32 synthase / 23S rRNA pseudouridine746 synthase